MDRYNRQKAFKGLGDAGQKRLLEARAAVVGLGAIGGTCASLLCRAGIGKLRFADADAVELRNLHRQILYSEADAFCGELKVDAAGRRFYEMNSAVWLEPVYELINADNIGEFLEDVDVLLDATDNLKTRFIINDACVRRRIPWVYCGVQGAAGMTASFLPGGPCLRCILDEVPDDYHAASAEGVIGMIPSVMASIQAAEAVKILTGSAFVRDSLMVVDLWGNETDYIKMKKNPHCSVCGLTNT